MTSDQAYIIIALAAISTLAIVAALVRAHSLAKAKEQSMIGKTILDLFALAQRDVLEKRHAESVAHDERVAAETALAALQKRIGSATFEAPAALTATTT